MHIESSSCRIGMSRGWWLAAIMTLALVVTAPGRAEALCTSWPTSTSVDPGEFFLDTISVSGLASGLYFISVDFSGSASLINLALSAVPGGSYNNGQQGFSGTGSTLYLSFLMWEGETPGSSSTVSIQVKNVLQQVVCSHNFVVTAAGDPCPLDATWLGSPIDALYDGANCYVHAVPAGDGNPFVYDNKYYVSRGPNNVCEAGFFDGANCYLGAPPSGKTGFFWGSAFYYTP
jgi:hypothetical protein